MKDGHKNPCDGGGLALQFGHLGGTATGGDPDSWCPEVWDWLVEDFGARSALDVGCGVGFAQEYFYERGLFSFGVDCAQVLEHHRLTKRDGAPLFVRSHDFTTGPCLLAYPFDLAWCCEVAEHVSPEFEDHIVQTVARNARKVIAFSSAPKGAGGFHHVNCRPPEHWVERFLAAGWAYDQERTLRARLLSDWSNGRGPHNYFRRSGLVFTPCKSD